MRVLHTFASLVFSQSHREYTSSRPLLPSSLTVSKTQLQEDPVSGEAYNMPGYTYRHTNWGTLTFVSRKPGRVRAA